MTDVDHLILLVVFETVLELDQFRLELISHFDSTLLHVGKLLNLRLIASSFLFHVCELLEIVVILFLNLLGLDFDLLLLRLDGSDFIELRRLHGLTLLVLMSQLCELGCSDLVGRFDLLLLV